MCLYKYGYLLLQIFLILCGAEVVRSCMKCFTSPADRANMCNHAVSLGKMEAEDCLQRLHRGFEPLDKTSIAFTQIRNIKNYIKSFENAIKKIDKLYYPPAWVEQFEKLMAEFIKGVKDRVARHPVAECRPPCGLQKASRVFSCSRCAEEDCQLPVACPIKDVIVEEYDKTVLHCKASFILSYPLKVFWKYAKNLRVTDLSYFKDLFSGEDQFVTIKPVRVHHKGTYACEIMDENDDIILRGFYYLDVTHTKSKAGSDIEAQFHRALVENLPTQVNEEEEDEKTIEHGPSTKDAILKFLQSPISYAIYAGVCFLLVTFLWRYAVSVDWSNRTRPESLFSSIP